jgi:hypothetical protein
MNKTCSYCKISKPLDEFHYHPTAKYNRKHYCKACSVIAGKKAYDAKLAAMGKSRRCTKPVVVKESTAKRGDVNEDGLVFHSKRKVPAGYREWWVSKEKFEEICNKARNRFRERYANDKEFWKHNREKDRSEQGKARKRKWNNKNRHFFSNWFSGRRAKIRGNFQMLTEEEKKQVSDFYKFRDILNKAHGKTMFHVDHIVPIAKGGKHTPQNIQVATATYNVRKATNAKPKD